MITPSEQGARQVFHDLPYEARSVVSEWLATGVDLRDALIRSNALGRIGKLITPRDAGREELRNNAGYDASWAILSERVKAIFWWRCVTVVRLATVGNRYPGAIFRAIPSLFIVPSSGYSAR